MPHSVAMLSGRSGLQALVSARWVGSRAAARLGYPSAHIAFLSTSAGVGATAIRSAASLVTHWRFCRQYRR
eukprot:240355-Prorocentrum_minimum.AAC.3